MQQTLATRPPQQTSTGLQLLQELNLAGNLIDDDACVALAACLSQLL